MVVDVRTFKPVKNFYKSLFEPKYKLVVDRGRRAGGLRHSTLSPQALTGKAGVLECRVRGVAAVPSHFNSFLVMRVFYFDK